jgi:hypothetical protein
MFEVHNVEGKKEQTKCLIEAKHKIVGHWHPIKVATTVHEFLLLSKDMFT